MTTFELIHHPRQSTAVVHEVVPMSALRPFFARAFSQVSAAMQAQGVQPVGPPFAHSFGMPGEEVEVEAGFPVIAAVAQAGAVHGATLPAGRCVHGLHLGPYETLRATYAELAQWARAQRLGIRDDMWEVYLSDPQREPDPARWQTEIFWPVG